MKNNLKNNFKNNSKNNQKVPLTLREYCCVRASGRSPYPLINAIRNSSISCMEQSCKGEVFSCQILKSDLPQFQKLAEFHHMHLEIQEQERALFRKLKRYRFRFGIPLGMILSAGILFYYSNTVTNIEIQGNSVVQDSVILAMLEEQNVRPGTWITEIDMNHCETLLRIQIPEISWAGIRHHGSKLVVEVTEETPQVEMLQERTPCHIIARYDAQITNVEVYSGQLLCLIGDGVAKGDIIVNGSITDPETNQHYYRHSYAKITGIYQQETDFTEPFLTSRTELTGNSVRQKWFRLFNLRIPLQFIHPDYSEFQSAERDTAFQFLSRELPCGIFQKTTSETQTSVTERSEEEVRLALNSDLVRYEKNFLADTEILDRKLEFQTTPDGIQCHAVYTVKGEIGMTSEFFIDKNQSVPETEPDTDLAS